jgi:hypothetical protein
MHPRQSPGSCFRFKFQHVMMMAMPNQIFQPYLTPCFYVRCGSSSNRKGTVNCTICWKWLRKNSHSTLQNFFITSKKLGKCFPNFFLFYWSLRSKEFLNVFFEFFLPGWKRNMGLGWEFFMIAWYGFLIQLL